jgi:hypothetical protein
MVIVELREAPAHRARMVISETGALGFFSGSKNLVSVTRPLTQRGKETDPVSRFLLGAR